VDVNGMAGSFSVMEAAVDYLPASFLLS
jgi:hypothetical protein